MASGTVEKAKAKKAGQTLDPSNPADWWTVLRVVFFQPKARTQYAPQSFTDTGFMITATYGFVPIVTLLLLALVSLEGTPTGRTSLRGIMITTGILIVSYASLHVMHRRRIQNGFVRRFIKFGFINVLGGAFVVGLLQSFSLLFGIPDVWLIVVLVSTGFGLYFLLLLASQTMTQASGGATIGMFIVIVIPVLISLILFMGPLSSISVEGWESATWLYERYTFTWERSDGTQREETSNIAGWAIYALVFPVLIAWAGVIAWIWRAFEGKYFMVAVSYLFSFSASFAYIFISWPTEANTYFTLIDAVGWFPVIAGIVGLVFFLPLAALNAVHAVGRKILLLRWLTALFLLVGLASLIVYVVAFVTYVLSTLGA